MVEEQESRSHPQRLHSYDLWICHVCDDIVLPNQQQLEEGKWERDVKCQ